MDKNKLIIHYDETIKPEVALRRAAKVVSQGKVSEGPCGEQYCFHTSFINGDQVNCPPKKKGVMADTFYCYNEEPVEDSDGNENSSEHGQTSKECKDA